MSDDLYQVLFQAGNGPEQLSDPETRSDAEHTARELSRKGYSVGSVMHVDDARAYMADRYSPAYRGVKVPDDLRADGQPYSVYNAWKRGVDETLDGEKPKPANVDPFAPDLTMSREVADFILRSTVGLFEEGYWPKGYDAEGRHGGTDGQDYDDDLLRRAADIVGRDKIKHRELLRYLAELDAETGKDGAS